MVVSQPVTAPTRPARADLSAIPYAPTAAGTISPRPSATQPMDTYRARKGESLRDVLRRWADRASIDLVWTMKSDIILQHDYSFVGPFNRAVMGLLSAYPESGIKTTLAMQGTPPLERQPFVEEARAPMVAPQTVAGADLQDFTPQPPPPVDRTRSPLVPYASVLDGSAGPARDVYQPPVRPTVLPMKAGVDQAVAVQQQPVVPPSVGPVRRWRALTGASVRQVIQAWAEEVGLPVLWMAPDDFAVRASINQTTDFGGAVNTILGQYAYDAVRPQGQIYRDPHTGQSTLVVRIVK